MNPTLPLTLETIIIISLGTALVLALLIILMINKGRRAARRDCAAARAELERTHKQVPTLRTSVQTADSYTSLLEFEPDKLYTLLACGDLVLDDKSTNGTFCNGTRVKEKMLEFGDLITVGDTTLLFSCEGFELKDTQPEEAIRALEQCLNHRPAFLAALKNLAFLLERDITRKKETQPLWDKIIKLEKRG